MGARGSHGGRQAAEEPRAGQGHRRGDAAAGSRGRSALGVVRAARLEPAFPEGSARGGPAVRPPPMAHDDRAADPLELPYQARHHARGNWPRAAHGRCRHARGTRVHRRRRGRRRLDARRDAGEGRAGPLDGAGHQPGRSVHRRRHPLRVQRRARPDCRGLDPRRPGRADRIADRPLRRAAATSGAGDAESPPPGPMSRVL